MRVLAVVALALCVGLVSLPSEAQTGKPLSQADVTKINEVNQIFAEAILAKDWATLADLYTDDGVLCPPNEPSVKGRAAIRAWMEEFPPITEFKLNNVKVEGRDDLAYVMGTYSLTMTPPGAQGPVKDSGKYVEIRRRQPDGKWLMAVDMFNSDLAIAAPPE